MSQCILQNSIEPSYVLPFGLIKTCVWLGNFTINTIRADAVYCNLKKLKILIVSIVVLFLELY